MKIGTCSFSYRPAAGVVLSFANALCLHKLLVTECAFEGHEKNATPKKLQITTRPTKKKMGVHLTSTGVTCHSYALLEFLQKYSRKATIANLINLTLFDKSIVLPSIKKARFQQAASAL